MRIFDSIRGHFALLAKRQLETLPEGAPFTIISVVSTVPREEDWKVVIKPASGKSNSIYVTDILRVYTWLVSSIRRAVGDVERNSRCSQPAMHKQEEFLLHHEPIVYL